MKKTLGGQRLGSGNKMETELHGFGSSTHNLDTTIATTMGIGTLLPIHNSLVLAGDKRDIELDAYLMTKPTEGPLFGSFKLQVDVFTMDIRLVVAKLHMNLLEAGLDMSEIKLPQLRVKSYPIDWLKDPNNQQIGSSCVLKYLGISGVGDHDDDVEIPMRYFNAVQYLMYWDIYKNYYANKQEKVGYVIHNEGIYKNVDTVTGLGSETATIEEYPDGNADFEIMSNSYINMTYTGTPPDPTQMRFVLSPSGLSVRALDVFATATLYTGSTNLQWTNPILIGETIGWWAYQNNEYELVPKLVEFPLGNIDEMKMDILAGVRLTTPFIIDESSIEPYNLPLKLNSNDVWSKALSQEGLAVKTYQSDVMNNWLDTEWITSVNERSKIETDIDGKWTIDNFLLKEKLYNHLNRIAVAGATVDDMMEVSYDVQSRTRPEIPVFEGGLSKELVFEQVISNSQTEDQPLGTIAGRGTLSGKHKGGKIRINNEDTQHKYYMVIASLTPRLMYTQGNKWDMNLKTYDDMHKPIFDQIGFQDLLTDTMASWDSFWDAGGVGGSYSAGKQPSWINYQTEINRAFGLFAEQDAEGWMILDRNYQADPITHRIKDLTTYIDPAKYNGIFAYEALDAQNIWAQFSIKDTARRKMSANQIPKM